MKFFVCLLDQGGAGAMDASRRRYEELPRSRGLQVKWYSLPHAAVLIASNEPDGDPTVVHDGEWIAVGAARLDNRSELERWCGRAGRRLSDLALVLRVITQDGTKHIPRFQGDFGFVVWNGPTRTAIAACDIFALKKLYYSEREGTLAFASRAEALALDVRYEVQYLAELLASCTPSPDLTVYEGVHSIPAATIAILEPGKLATTRYWRPEDFEVDASLSQSEPDTVEAFRELLAEAVRLRVSGTGHTWAQLSGGLDSSSVVSVVQWLAERGSITEGVAGTVTFVDRQGTETDERQYSNLVVRHWGIRNEAIVDPPFWYDESYPPPSTDLPTFFLPFYPRERRLCAAVRAAGGRVLLTGQGGDELLTGSMLFFSDWVAEGRVWQAVREMARRAAIGRVSFWELAYRNALLPLLPKTLRLRLAREQGQIPGWVEPAMISRYALRSRGTVQSSCEGRIGHKYEHAARASMRVLASAPQYGVIADSLDIRHPFLFRPLVELALRLPPEFCARPHSRKWILREALRGILPEAVRTRVGKGGALGLYAQTLIAQRALLEPLVRNPMTAELGLVDGAKLRAAFERIPLQPSRREQPHADLHFTLCIEAWLQMRSGRWPTGGHLNSSVRQRSSPVLMM